MISPVKPVWPRESGGISLEPLSGTPTLSGTEFSDSANVDSFGYICMGDIPWKEYYLISVVLLKGLWELVRLSDVRPKEKSGIVNF